MRDDRRLNALARGRLRARRGAAPRVADGTDVVERLQAVLQVSPDESPSPQTLVAILSPVLGCRLPAEPPALATRLLLPEC